MNYQVSKSSNFSANKFNKFKCEIVGCSNIAEIANEYMQYTTSTAGIPSQFVRISCVLADTRWDLFPFTKLFESTRMNKTKMWLKLPKKKKTKMRKKSRLAQRWSDEVFYIYNIHAGLNIDQMGDRPMQISNRMNSWFLNLSCGSSFVFNHQRLRRNIRGMTIPSTLVRRKNNKHAYSLSFPHFICSLKRWNSKVRRCFPFKNNVSLIIFSQETIVFI